MASGGSAYALLFSRIVTGFVFGLSIAGKLHDWQTFEQAIRRFRVLPVRLVRVFAALFVMGELGVVVLMFLGDRFLFPGFGLAILLLLLFSAALLSVLYRGLDVPCNCFGPSEKPVSRYDLLRNTGLIGFALLGFFSLPSKQASLGAAEVALLAVMAITFSVVWVHLGDLARLFHTLNP